MKNTIFKNYNTRTKIFSIFAAIFLWMYVIAVVDPEEKKVVENIPITITNENELKNNSLIIYPKDSLVTDITLEGKLSELQKLNKNNINIYGDIINPVEGKNVVNLRTNISNRVSRELKDSNFVVNLEKKIQKNVDVKIDAPVNELHNIFSVVPEVMQVEVSGPRTLVNTVTHVGYSIAPSKIKEGVDRQTISVELIAYDKDNIPIELDINPRRIDVDISFIISKEVPVKLNYDGDEYDRNSFLLSPDKVIIMGSKDRLKDINDISTEKVDDEDLHDVINKKLRLILPNNISVKGGITQIEVNKK